MSDALLHIGYHKTATNWFQRHFYPRVENAAYIHRKKVRQAFLHDSALVFDAGEAVIALGVQEGSRYILCEEELSGNIHSGGLFGFLSKEVGHRLKAVFPDADVVIFIRNQLDMIGSVYKQYVKEGGTHGPERYLFPAKRLPQSGFQPAKVPLFSFDHFDYTALITHYEALFGRDRVHVYLFEDFERDNQGFGQAFAARHGLEVSAEAFGGRKVFNPGYQWGTLYLARLLSLFTREDVIDKHYLLHVPGLYKNVRKLLKHVNRLPVMGGEPDARSLLGSRIADGIRLRYAASNRSLAEARGLDLARYDYPL